MCEVEQNRKEAHVAVPNRIHAGSLWRFFWPHAARCSALSWSPLVCPVAAWQPTSQRRGGNQRCVLSQESAGRPGLGRAPSLSLQVSPGAGTPDTDI